LVKPEPRNETDCPFDPELAPRTILGFTLNVAFAEYPPAVTTTVYVVLNMDPAPTLNFTPLLITPLLTVQAGSPVLSIFRDELVEAIVHPPEKLPKPFPETVASVPDKAPVGGEPLVGLSVIFAGSPG
jgi:hypothetical protein